MTELTPGADEPAPGLVAGRYQVVRPIGRGGMGTVWLATDERLGRPVALKRLAAIPGAGHPDEVRALREARHAASLNHPNVVAVFDVVEHEGASWLVMEHVDGPTLAEAVRSRGPMRPRGAADLGMQLAAALAAAHAAGIIHRDIKPANVLISERRAKLADFGTARGGADDQLTRSGLVTGTPTYMAPEVADGHEPDEASDLWALGATLYLAVEGHDAYASQGNALATLRHIVTTDPAPAEDAGPLLPVIERLMARDPAARGTAAQAREDLERVAAGREVEATSVLPVAAAKGGPAAGSATGPSTAQPSPRVPAGGGSGPSAPARRRPSWVPWALLALALVVGVGVALAVLGDGDETQAAPTTSPTSTPATTSTTPSSATSTTPSSTTTSTTSSPSSTTSSPSPSVAFPQDEVEAFLTEHFATVTTNPDVTWGRLTPKFQEENAGGRQAYEEFWSGIESVSVSDISVDEESGVVTLQMRYTPVGRPATVEPKTLTLVRQGGDLRIDDEGSR